MVKSHPLLLLFAMCLSAPIPHIHAIETRDTAPAQSPAFLSETSADLKLSTYQQITEWLRDFELQKLTVPELQERLTPHEAELRDALKSAMAIQRSLSTRALAFAIDRASALNAIKEVLAHDAEEGIRAESAASLGNLGDAAAVEPLVAALRDESARVREASILALGKLKDERACAGLLERLRYDTSHAVRMAAARTLPKFPLEKLQEDLTAILESEQDERVRWMLAEALRAMRAAGEETEEDTASSPDAFSAKLKALASDMRDVEKKLRDDRHDSAVQNDQQDVSIKLSEMIRTLEDMEKMKAEAAQSSKEGKKRWAMLSSSGKPSTATQSKPSKPASDSEREAAHVAARVAEQRNRWANLPPSARDEMLQVFRPEVPIRWRKRLEAYFLSVAAEETRKK